MTRTACISLLLLWLATGIRAQEDDYLILDEVTIEGEVREPAVAIISARLKPELSTFKLEKSFLAKLRRPDPRIVNLNPGIRLELKISNPAPLLERRRTVAPVSLEAAPVKQEESNESK